MKLCFDSIEEVKEFVGNLKGTRNKKGEEDGTPTGQAPAPLQPPQTNAGPSFAPGGYVPPGAGAVPGGAFPAAGAPAPDPAVTALVNRISTRIDSAIQTGQPADQVLAWFRGQCGAEAANADMNAIKTVFLPKAPMPTLENIAKLMNA